MNTGVCVALDMHFTHRERSAHHAKGRRVRIERRGSAGYAERTSAEPTMHKGQNIWKKDEEHTESI